MLVSWGPKILFFGIYPIFTHLNAITLPWVGIDFKYMIVG
jgi:hypothetical protein